MSPSPRIGIILTLTCSPNLSGTLHLTTHYVQACKWNFNLSQLLDNTLVYCTLSFSGYRPNRICFLMWCIYIFGVILNGLLIFTKFSFSFPKIIPKSTHMHTLHTLYTNMSFYITFIIFHIIGQE